MSDLNESSIPKIIHYCWFGSNKMDNIQKGCLKSWKKHLSGYQFMRWDESNIDLQHHTFLKEVYKQEKWAFVSDYVRLLKLYEYGGIYLDTDMLILKSLNEFLNFEAFFGAENLNFISCGIIGAKKQNPFIKKCLLQYDKITINEKTNFAEITIPQLITSAFRSNFDFKGDFKSLTNISGIAIFPSIYFYSLPFKERHIKNKIKYSGKNSYAVHLWDESWKDQRIIHYLRKGKYSKGYQEIMRRREDFSFSYFRKIVRAFIKSLISF